MQPMQMYEGLHDLDEWWCAVLCGACVRACLGVYMAYVMVILQSCGLELINDGTAVVHAVLSVAWICVYQNTSTLGADCLQ